MKNKELKELHAKSLAELSELERNLTKELFQIKIDIAAGKTRNVKLLGLKKQDLARVKTIHKEKEADEKA